MKLAGKVALVTGAAGGIGRASALALAREGADIALNDLVQSPVLDAVASEIGALGRRVLCCPVDIANQEAVDAMVALAADKLGQLDLFISCAVYSDRDYFHVADMAGFRRTIDVSMWGSFYVLRACANQMIRQGRGGAVVIVSSPHAHVPLPSCMAYNMAKAAQDMMAKTAAVELLKHRIRVNIVHPGWTDTPGERKFFSEEMLHKAAEKLPWGRLARPEEIARGVLFLADPASDYVTGSTVSIDGGSQLPWWSRRGTGDF